MKAIPFLILIFFFAIALDASARYGETLDQCRRRYGKETTTGKQHTFQKNGFTITCLIEDKTTECIAYQMHKNHKPAPIPLTVIKELLKSNGGTLVWTPTTNADSDADLLEGPVRWTSSDQKLEAIYNPEKHLLIISSIAWADANSAAIQAAEKNKAKTITEGL